MKREEKRDYKYYKNLNDRIFVRVDQQTRKELKESIQNLEEINPEYEKYYKEHRERGKKFDELKSKLSEADMEFIKKCENNNFIIRTLEQSWLYLQGYRDSVRSLKLFKVI